MRHGSFSILSPSELCLTSLLVCVLPEMKVCVYGGSQNRVFGRAVQSSGTQQESIGGSTLAEPNRGESGAYSTYIQFCGRFYSYIQSPDSIQLLCLIKQKMPRYKHYSIQQKILHIINLHTI